MTEPTRSPRIATITRVANGWIVSFDSTYVDILVFANLEDACRCVERVMGEGQPFFGSR